jgi:hypothetical protein
MHGPINVKSSNNTSKWQMGFNSAFKGLIMTESEGNFPYLCVVLQFPQQRTQHPTKYVHPNINIKVSSAYKFSL